MALLSPNVSLASVAKDNKKDEKGVEGEINKEASVTIIGNALTPTTSPLGSTLGQEEEPSFEVGDTEVYVVRKGDTLKAIAGMFDVTVDTILSVNDKKKGYQPKESDILLILGFSAVEHTVGKGETIKGIANRYKVPVEDIIASNHLNDLKIVVGDKLMIPGGELPTESVKPKIKNIAQKPSGNISVGSTIKNVIGKFINPVAGAVRTRGLTSAHKGVDFAAPEGTPIKSIAAGTVKFARPGENGGFGNMVIVRHDDGVEVLYAHMVRLGTSAGARVDQGEVIGFVGNTGRSRGDHLHMEIRGAKNTF